MYYLNLKHQKGVEGLAGVLGCFYFCFGVYYGSGVVNNVCGAHGTHGDLSVELFLMPYIICLDCRKFRVREQ